jgi:hypothetical protein
MRYPTKPCAAYDCKEQIKRRLLMCPRHWRMVPRHTQDLVINALDAWQRCSGSARDYVHAVAEAQLAVAIADGQNENVIASFTADVKRYQEAPK